MTKPSRVAVIVLLTSWGVHCFACAPVLPSSFLADGSEYLVARLPRTSFVTLASQILDVSESRLRSYTQTSRPPKSYADTGRQHSEAIDLADVKWQLERWRRPDENTFALYSDYQAIRAGSLSVYTQPGAASSKPAQLPPVLHKLPREYSLYLQGAVAYRSQDKASAVARWQELLDMPEADRIHRSVWAAYMCGRALLTSDPHGAIQYLAMTRRFAASGLHDPLDLASASLGWQAKAECLAGEYPASVAHYCELLKSGPVDIQASAFLSLERVCNSLLSQPEIKPEWTLDPLLNRLVTAHIVSEQYPANPSQSKWFDALERSHTSGVIPYADLAAWYYYGKGDVAMCQHWLDRADPLAPYGRWVRAKLLLRAGNVNEATTILEKLPEQFAPDTRAYLDVDDIGGPVRPFSSIHAELATVLLGTGNYNKALDEYIRAGYSEDAAYVAENVLTLDELERYVASNAKAGQNTGKAHDDALARVLVRRLARAGHWDKAIPCYAPELREPAAELVKCLRDGLAGEYTERNVPISEQLINRLGHQKDRKTADPSRATALHRAAEIIRTYGFELLGTEVQPDWLAYDGVFERDGASKYRLAQDQQQTEKWKQRAGAVIPILSASADEKARAARHAPVVSQRFHYRYLAADLLWCAAKYEPDNNLTTAETLYSAGTLIAARDPKEADRFYKAMVWRNLQLPYTQTAIERKWFPPEAPH